MQELNSKLNTESYGRQRIKDSPLHLLLLLSLKKSSNSSSTSNSFLENFLCVKNENIALPSGIEKVEVVKQESDGEELCQV